jgi:type III pantothenate kinase
MLMTIDIGNTNITIGVYQSDRLGPSWRVSTNHNLMSDDYGIQIDSLLSHKGLTPGDITGICLASVVPPLTSTFIQVCQEYIGQKPLVVDAGIKTGVKILYETPRSVGADRIVDAAAVQHLYGGPACVVDFGTGTTFNAISKDGDYLGGAIAPGIGIAAEALFQRAAKLPPVELATPPSVIGRNTAQSMQSGLIFGYVGLVEGMVARFRKELGPKMKVVATGGLTEIIARETDVIQIVAPTLTLDGLRIIWEMNQ